MSCLIVSNCRLVSSLVVMYSFLCSSAILPPCLVVLFPVSVPRLLLCRSLVSIYALSSSAFWTRFLLASRGWCFIVGKFQQFVVVYSLLISHLLLLFWCCLGYFFQFDLFVLSFFCICFFGLGWYLLLCFLVGHLFSFNSLMFLMVSKVECNIYYF